MDANNISAVPYNGQVRLTCTSHSHPAINAYRFYRFQELLGQNTTGIFDLIARDSGLYSCIPSNDAGPGEKAQVTLVVDGGCLDLVNVSVIEGDKLIAILKI